MQQRETRAVSFTTDASWLQQLGVDCVIWGPGSIEVAHKPDESLPVAEFRRAGELLDTLVRESS
jgi:acetylornithine deacetylase